MKYSGEEVNRAGEKLLNEDFFEHQNEFAAVLTVVSFWRSEHEIPLTNAYELVQKIALQIDRKAIFARRLKRIVSIARKLRRFRSMDLKNMQDIGGCRAIVTNQKKLTQILRELKRQPEFRWKDVKFKIKDYIECPKEDGYRSVHVIGDFAEKGSPIRRIEVQLRTYIQHYWATALEIVDLFTDQALKSNQGDKEWRTFFRLLSEHFALMDDIHLFENMSLPARRIAYQQRLKKHPKLKSSAEELRKCSKRLRVLEKFEAFAGSLRVVDSKLTQAKVETGFVLLKINLEIKRVESMIFAKTATKEAEAEYIRLEAETAKLEGIVVALVSSTAVGGIKEAYPNYFADSSRFAQHLHITLGE
ncbi:MAG TPA: RelA/SpoT domain-containing protein [Lacunisphaera sp.]